jgi:hypothetical protein
MIRAVLYSKGAAMMWMFMLCAALSVACVITSIMLETWDDSQSSGLT